MGKKIGFLIKRNQFHYSIFPKVFELLKLNVNFTDVGDFWKV